MNHVRSRIINTPILSTPFKNHFYLLPKIVFFSLHNYWVSGNISCDYQIQAVLSPLTWFMSEKNLLYPGRIFAYEADKSLRTLTSSRLRLFNGLQFCRSSPFIVSCLFTSMLPTSNHRNFKKDKFNCYPSCLFSLIFNWYFYLYDDYYL